MRAVFYALCAMILGFVVGYLCQPKVLMTTTNTRVDTVRVEVPKPYAIEKVRTEYVYVPTPADTVVINRTDTIVRVDSVLVPVEIERRVYDNESYRAVVSGAVIGNIHPALESMDLYTRTDEYQPPLIRPFVSVSLGREALGIGGGISIKDRVDVDVQYMRVRNHSVVTLGTHYRFNTKIK